MLLLAVLSVLFMLGLGFVAILHALADIDEPRNVSPRNAEPSMQGAISVGHV